MPITGHPPHRTGRAALSGSAAIAGFCPHRTHRAALPQWDLRRIDHLCQACWITELRSAIASRPSSRSARACFSISFLSARRSCPRYFPRGIVSENAELSVMGRRNSLQISVVRLGYFAASIPVRFPAGSFSVIPRLRSGLPLEVGVKKASEIGANVLQESSSRVLRVGCGRPRRSVISGVEPRKHSSRSS